MRWCGVISAIIICMSSDAVAQNDYGFRVLGRALPGEANCSIEAGTTLYLGSGNVLQIYNMTTPTAPVLLGQLPLKGQVEDIFINDNLAYIANGTKGLVIADISNSVNINLISHLQLPSEALGVKVIDFYAYVANLEGGFVIVDVSDPQLPFQASLYPVNQGAIGMDVQDTLACVACGYGGLYFLNVAHPDSPTQFALLDTTGTWAYDVKISGNYAYMAYALDPDGGGLKVINISNPLSPIVVGNLTTTYSFDRLELNGNYAFAAIENDGVAIATIATPTNPHLVGAWHNGYCKNVAFNDNKIFLAGGESGLWILNAANVAYPSLIGNIATYSACQDVVVAGRYAYLAEKPAGIRVIDIQNIAAPKPVYLRQFYFRDNAYQGVGEGISIENAHLFVVDYSDINGGQNDFRIYGLSNPAQPDSLGTYLLSSSPRGHKVQNDVAYITTGPTLKILDVRNPESIELLNNFEGDWHSAYGMDVSGNYMYLGTMNTGLRILNISNETLPIILGGLDTEGQTFAATYHNGYAYVADYGNGLRIVDVSDPTNPVEVSSITTYADCVDAGFIDDSFGSFAIVLFDNQVVAYDIADPAHPTEVGYYDTIDPHQIVTRGDTIYVADRMNGLHILLLHDEVGVAERPIEMLPGSPIISRNYPNPFNSSTTIEFTLPADGKATLEIFDIGGRKVAELLNGFATKGPNRVVWDCIDQSGKQLAGGVYLYRVTSGGRVASGRMVFLK